jgi:hypothetical protein
MKRLRIPKTVGCCLLCGWMGLFYGCAQTPDQARIDKPLQPTTMTSPGAMQSPAEQYAGEVLAYLMQVTLGKTGNPKLRQEWGERGLTLPLDYGAISAMMQGPEKDPRQVMVLDNNILGLSQVLYHYDKSLNLFQGENAQESVFPSKELLSIRVMLLQKMKRNEKVNLGALMDKKPQLLDPLVTAAEMDLGNTSLQRSEMKLLKDVIQSNPSFMGYLEHPFLVDMLYRIGAVSMDAYVQSKIQSARYTAYGVKQGQKSHPNKSVQVTLLPSTIQSFAYRSIDKNVYPGGFKPEETYLEAMNTFEHIMMGFLQKLVMAQMFDDDAKDTHEQNRRHGVVTAFIDEHLDVRSMDRRPFVVYPENAEKVIKDVCPDSDFNVIVLGKNVYLSMHILEVDAFPHINRVYLDIMDIRHGQVDYEISQISMFVFDRLKPIIASIKDS